MVGERAASLRQALRREWPRSRLDQLSMLQRCSTIIAHFATNLPPDLPSRLCAIHDVLSTRVLEVDTLPPGLLAPKNSRSRTSRVAHGSCHSRERVRCRHLSGTPERYHYALVTRCSCATAKLVNCANASRTCCWLPMALSRKKLPLIAVMGSVLSEIH